MRTINIILFAMAFSLCGYSQHIKVEKMVLENGLTVFLSEDHTNPEVFGGVITNAGGKNDPKDATGMAHYMEHMLFKGTETLGTINWEKEKVHIDNIFSLYDKLGKTTDEEERKNIQKQINEESLKAAEYAIPNEMSNLINSMGGTKMNAGTGPDNTLFYNAFPPNQIEKWLDLYSHRFMNPVFRSFQAELEVVYEEKNMYEDMFIMPLLEKFNKHFFKNHPYGQQTLIGTIDDLKNPSLTKMFEFFKTYYVANNMALIIVGDFDIEEIKPLIKEKFGKWRKGEIPEPAVYKEEPFNGRELIEVKMSPIKLGMLGFRTVPSGHEDELALKICNGILSNTSGTGLLDKLSLDNKLMAAQVMAMPYQDHGANIILYVPKILGQKLEDAEQLIMTEVNKLKTGDFEDWMVEAMKHEQYIHYLQAYESIEEKALMIANAFAQGKAINSLNEIPEKIKQVTKDDIIKVAEKYYGENYLVFNSKMGFPKKEKIDKPGYEPLKANTNKQSAYAKHFESIKSSAPKEKYVNMQDIHTTNTEGAVVYVTENPLNDIFTLKIKYGIGDHELPLVKYAANAMNYAGTENQNVSEFKNELSKIGCNYSIYSNNSYTVIEVTGIEENFNKAVALLSKLVSKPKLEQEKIKKIVDEIKTERKMEKSEPDNIASALFDYVRYKEKSPFIDRLTIKEIKALQAPDLEKTFKEATEYFTEIHLVAAGNKDMMTKALIEQFNLNTEKKKTSSPVFIAPEKYDANTVFFVNKKKALQSKIFFFANSADFNIENKPHINEFNMYFGGGFSGLVLQEIREFRSLAYGAGARFRTPNQNGKPTSFVGYIGTQADKTNEAIDVFQDLVRNMPSKTERTPMIKDYLVQSAFTNKPNFRDMSETIVRWKYQGYKEDPAKFNVEQYKQFEFKDIEQFYKAHLKDAPIVTIIAGNKKKIDFSKLESYGKIIEVKEKDIFK